MVLRVKSGACTRAFGAQGTIEYLLIVAVVVVVSLVVVGLVVSQTESVSSVSSTTSSIAQKSGVVGAGDVVVDVDREGIIVLENNSGENISVTGLSFGGIDNNYSVSVVAGDKKSFSVLSVGDACSCVGYEGQKRPCVVVVKTVSQYGLEKNYSMNINVDCVSNATPIDLNKLVSPTSYGATAALGEYCLSNYKCLSGFCDSYLNNVCTDGSVDSNCADGTECAEPNVCTSHLCVDGDIGVSCSANSDCYSGYCGDDSWWCNVDCEQKCRTGEVGSPCVDVSQCATDYCGYGLCSNGEIGDYCSSGADCALGYCDTYMTVQCTDGSIGSYCGSGADCALGFCDTYWNYQCTSGDAGEYCGDNSGCASPYVCDTADTYTCVDGSLGVSCTSGLGCDSGFCYGSICTDGLIGTGCDSGNDCNSGFCDTDNNICSTGAPGSSCGANADCDTYNCISNVCSADLPVITTGLVGYWPFNETSGAIAIDYSGSDKNGVLYNTVLVNQTGKVGKAYYLDGINDYVKMTGFVMPQNISFLAWVKSDTATWNMPGWFASARMANGLIVHPNTDSSVGFYVEDRYGSHNYLGMCTPSNPITEWNLYGFSFNSITGQGFLICNDTFTTISPSIPVDRPGGSITLYVGLDNGFSRYGKGLIDEVAIWDRPLAPAEVLNVYNSGNGISLIS